jgi:site-specific recombinase XerD
VDEIVLASHAALTHLEELTATADLLLDASLAANTRRAYQSDWRQFAAWCNTHGRASLPALPSTIVLYITDLATVQQRKVTTIERRLAAIRKAHRTARLTSPTEDIAVEQTMRGIRRSYGTPPIGKAAAVTDIMRVMVEALPATSKGTRDRALLLVGFAGAFRRSELVSLDVSDVQFVVEGMVLTLRRSKTDQAGEGMVKGVAFGASPATCPVQALRAWLDISKIAEGPLFRSLTPQGRVKPQRLSDYEVAKIIKASARRAGLEPQDFSGHSLRVGLATAAARAGVPERIIAEQTGHKDMNTLRRYIRRGELFRENASAEVGL